MISLVASAVVLACQGNWGASDNCGGCSSVLWKDSASNPLVKTPAVSAKGYWVLLSTLAATDIVFTNATAKDGDKGSCATATATTKAQLSGITPIPAPSPTPAPQPSSNCLTSGCAIAWTAPTLNEDGSAIKPILKYLLNVNEVALDIGPVLAYTLVKPAGDYTLSLQTVTADGTSGPTKSAVAHVVAVTPPPIPAPTVITVETPGLWTLKKGTSNTQTGLADYAACRKAAEVLATVMLTKYSCTVIDSLTVKLP